DVRQIPLACGYTLDWGISAAYACEAGGVKMHIWLSGCKFANTLAGLLWTNAEPQKRPWTCSDLPSGRKGANLNTKLLIDAIMHQTTVLIAQLSTAAGIRAPLAHVADQVFVELAREIEAQGVSRKVAADM